MTMDQEQLDQLEQDLRLHEHNDILQRMTELEEDIRIINQALYKVIEQLAFVKAQALGGRK